MRYTEYEFTIDHIFDFIRIIFSSVILSPIRLVSEITKKAMYIEKSKITKCCQIAIIINLIILGVDVVNMIRGKEVYMTMGSTPLSSELISLFFVGLVYYASTIYDQPSLSYNKKPKDNKSKKRKVIKDDIDDILDDEEDLIRDCYDYDDDIVDVEEPKFKPNKTETSTEDKEPSKPIVTERPKLEINTSNLKPKEGKVSLGEIKLSINDSLLGNPKSEDLPEDNAQLSKVCDNAVKEDKFGIGNISITPPTIDKPSINLNVDRNSLNLQNLNAFIKDAL